LLCTETVLRRFAMAAALASTDTAAEIQKLADLHASGALTDEEFAAMKKKLLGL